MSRPTPQIIGIVGGSCSGKSWLADRLLQVLPGKSGRLSLDDFYLDRTHLSLERRARLNFDHPRAIDWQRFEAVLARLSAGLSAAVPRYDFASHSRSGLDGIFSPAGIVLVEGLWLFRRATVRQYFTLKIFIQGADSLCAARRVRRDTAERGRTREQVLEQWERYTQPMSRKFVAPQVRHADVVLDAPIREEAVLAVAENISAQSQVEVGI